MHAPLVTAGVLAFLLLVQSGTQAAGYLFGPAAGRGKAGPRQGTPYVPKEGDLVFYDDHNPAWTALFALAGTGPPLHVGIVVKKPDGRPGVLEAGPDDTLWVKWLDVGRRLHQFRRDFRGTITIRRCKKTLTAKESAALTAFARAQEGKRYAALRLLAQGTPLRVRGRLERLMGETRLDRDAWICSELAVAAATVAGLCDPRVIPANAAYPRDLVDNRRHDLGASWHDAAEWNPGGVKARRLPFRRPIHP